MLKLNKEIGSREGRVCCCFRVGVAEMCLLADREAEVKRSFILLLLFECRIQEMFVSHFIFLFIYLFIYFWWCWVFVASWAFL